MSRMINGKPIIDAKKPLTLTVTARDVKRASPKDPHKCAIALAAMRQTKCITAMVHLSRLLLEFEKLVVRYQLQERVAREIVALDRGGTFAPDDYKFNPPRKSLRERSFTARPLRKSHNPTERGGKRFGGKLPYMAGKGEKRPPPHVTGNIRPVGTVEFDKPSDQAAE